MSNNAVNDLFLPSDPPFKRKCRHEPKVQPQKTLRRILTQERAINTSGEPSYASIEAPPSLYPAKKYCDLTGLEAPYIDPKTRLQYSSAAAFALGRRLSEAHAKAFLGLRKKRETVAAASLITRRDRDR